MPAENTPVEGSGKGRPSSGRFEIQVHAHGDRVHICLQGELDLGTAPEFEAVAARLIDHADEVILDIEKVSFIDSSGLRELLSCREQCRRTNTGFLVTRGTQQAQRLFEVAGVLGVLPFTDETLPNAETTSGR